MDQKKLKFLEDFPPYEEVQCLIEFFEEISKEPYTIRDNEILANLKGSKYQVRLGKSTNGVYLEIGIWEKDIQHFWEKVRLYAGLIPTGVWVYGKGNEYRHELLLEVKKLSLNEPQDRKIFERVKEFYEKVKLLKLDEKTVFDGLKFSI